MKTGIIVLIAVGATLLVGGSALAITGAVNANKVVSQTNTYAIEQDFMDIRIDSNVSDVYFKISEDGKASAVAVENDKYRHEIAVEDQTLVITTKDLRKWYERPFSFDFAKKSLTLYLPKTSYRNLEIHGSTGDFESTKDFDFENALIQLSTGDMCMKSDVHGAFEGKVSTGNIDIEGATMNALTLEGTTGRTHLKDVKVAEGINLKSSTGDIHLEAVRANSLNATASVGEVTLTDVIVKKHLQAKTSTGRITLNDCDAETLRLETSAGSIWGSLLSPKIFNVHTSTGKVNVPTSTTGGLCEVYTSTGSVTLTIKE